MKLHQTLPVLHCLNLKMLAGFQQVYSRIFCCSEIKATIFLLNKYKQYKNSKPVRQHNEITSLTGKQQNHKMLSLYHFLLPPPPKKNPAKIIFSDFRDDLHKVTEQIVWWCKKEERHDSGYAILFLPSAGFTQHGTERISVYIHTINTSTAVQLSRWINVTI